MEQLASEYFAQLFATSQPPNIQEVTELVDRVVTPQMNEDLFRPFTADEVRKALFQIHPSKALGPDGMSLLFFQKY